MRDHAPDLAYGVRCGGSGGMEPPGQAMIIKGGQAGNVGFWSSHLQRDDTNDRAEVKEIYGLMAEDLPTALREMEAVAAGSRSRGNFMYQANLNPEQGEHLTDEQWKEAIDLLEKKMGFEGHQRVVVEHDKHGRVHRHVVWNRVDVDTLKVADITHNYGKHEQAAREIEARFDLTPTPAPSRDQKPEPSPELWEIRAAERSGIDPAAVKQDMTAIWQTTDSGKAFAAAVNESGYILAKGDRRDFCIIDQAGDVHSVARRIEGAKAKDIRERFADLDRDSLPSVAEARQQQREAHPTPEAVREAWEGRQRPAAEQAPEPTPEPEKAPAPDLKASAGAAKQSTGEGHEAKLAPDPAAAWQEKIDTRAAARAEREDKAQANWQQRRADHVASHGDAPAKASPLRVMDKATGAVDLLANVVDSLLTSKPQLPPEGVQRIRAQRQALAAMERIAESLERGDNLHAADIGALTPTHLENIKAKGDAGVLEMISDMERQRQRDYEYQRTRER